MKKVIALLFIMVIIFMHLDTRAFVAKHIDLKLKDNETSVVFLRLKNSKSLLINDINTSNLFILDYSNDSGIKKTLKIFDSRPDIFYLKRSIDKKVDNIHIIKQDGIFRFRINNYTLCIYDGSNSDIKNCDFIYLMKLNSSFVPSENISTIFYDERFKSLGLMIIL